ncbi:hypothetical protein BJV78DRAFT_281827 [Lactifluus subvellereus]|nr:hypothetical protein BJV78DRAFT_281827 [Lactifluus subvellereus]
MSARLASFRGPSTPSSSPVKQAQSPRSTQSAKLTESTYHRKVRALLQELRQACGTWDDLVRKDGLKAVRELIDARTDLDNMLALVPEGEQPRSRLVGPKLSYMDDRIAAVDLVISKLKRQFQKMTTIVDGMEALLATRTRRKDGSGSARSQCGLLGRWKSSSPQYLTSSGRTGAPWNCTLNFSTPCAVTTSLLRYPAKPPIRGLNSRTSKRTVGTQGGKPCVKSKSIDGTPMMMSCHFCGHR